jgi:hypothetical protein
VVGHDAQALVGGGGVVVAHAGKALAHTDEGSAGCRPRSWSPRAA